MEESNETINKSLEALVEKYQLGGIGNNNKNYPTGGFPSLYLIEKEPKKEMDKSKFFSTTTAISIKKIMEDKINKENDKLFK